MVHILWNNELSLRDFVGMLMVTTLAPHVFDGSLCSMFWDILSLLDVGCPD